MADDPNVDYKDLASILNKVNKEKRSGLKLDELSNKQIKDQAKIAIAALNKKRDLQSKYDKLLKDGKITEESRAKIQERINKTTKNHGKQINENLKKRLKANEAYKGLVGLQNKFSTSLKNIPTAVFALIVKSFFELDKQVTGLVKNLAISKTEAFALRDSFAQATNTSDNLRLNATALLNTQAALNDLRGTAEIFDTKTLKAATNITDAGVLTNEQAVELLRTSKITGETFEQSLKSQIGSVTAINKQRGVSLNYNKVLQDSNKITGQIRAQLAGNPEQIAKAVALAKSFGMELDQVKQTSSALLDFQSSIGAELEAELLTGKQLNLERARLAALTGDYDTLLKEINNNVGDFYEFSSLNVLQQDALAKSLGMSSDQLSDMLLKEADLESMKADAKAAGDEEMLNRLTALDTQEKFNKAIERMKELFVQFIAPYTERFVKFLDKTPNIGKKIAKVFRTGIIVALTTMGVMLGMRIAQMITMIGLMKAQLALAAATAGAKNPTAGLTFGTSAIATAAVIVGGVAGLLAGISLPKLAEGGIVTKPTLAMVGEGGESEAVIPLSKLNNFVDGANSTDVNTTLEKGFSAMLGMLGEQKIINVNVSSNPFEDKNPNFGAMSNDAKYDSPFV